jgi:hypothetical protein
MKRPQPLPGPPYDTLELMLRARDTGLDRHLSFQRLFRVLNADSEDLEVGEMLVEQLSAAERLDRLEPDPLRRTSPLDVQTFAGDILLGVTRPFKVPYSIPRSQLTTHCLVTGITGGTKTNLILLIMCQLLQVAE